MSSKTMSKASLIVPSKANFSQSFESSPPSIQKNVPFKYFLSENLSGPNVSLDDEIISTTDSLISLRLPKDPNEEQEKRMTEHCNSCSAKVSDDISSLPKTSECAKISDQAENADSGKSSMCRASTCSNVSDESSSSGNVSKPHKGNDSRWEAIKFVRAKYSDLDLSHFIMLKKVGSGDIGSVYLSELIETKNYFALKVMDKLALATRKKLARAQMELDILQCLDHPFLPTLYSHFEMDKFSCLVMEFCPGGDLHTLRQRQPGKHFSESAAKFYVAEVLLALEYLHMLGIIYRDLKPENILVREDGHIMLSDFDLSLRCSFSPTLVSSSSHSQQTTATTTDCIGSRCMQPSCSVSTSCFSPRLFRSKSKNKRSSKPPREPTNQVIPLPELIVEPTDARSMSFVGTHEYLAPEIILGHGHGSAVDWWTLGIFLYELLFGKTPFKGSNNRATLANVVEQPLRFPESPSVSYGAKDLIRGLLMKDPKGRLGVKRGAAEIKQHMFFEGVNWALIRCTSPPEVPRPMGVERLTLGASSSSQEKDEGDQEIVTADKHFQMDFF